MKTTASDVPTAQGFTLIEVVVVVFIIGVIVTFATLSVSQNSDRYIENEAKRLQQLIRLAAEDAVYRGSEMSVFITTTGYTFARLAGPKWEPITDDKLFRQREFPDTIEIKLIVDEQEVDLSNKEKPAQIYLLSSGEVMPAFALQLSGESEVKYRITGSSSGEITYQQPQTTDTFGG